ncbi:methyltransferase [Roseicyclus sp. F158]|uniref:Methyltransferase n=1 Tax=Tropicimonas omnivorans TaxID=3075590 RepID=A0ABU3DBY5_9RHOB|nr:methyltransferase [Roseicyclus sp. F158]MDT0681218.1 methyltransferase [Roseicyclus sp. F158]
MSTSRLSLALDQGLVSVPETGEIVVFRPRSDADLSALPKERLRIVQGFRPDHDAWVRRGYTVYTDAPEGFAAALVMVPRAKDEARALIAEALAPGGPVIVDGQKTDGIDSLLKEVRRRDAEVSEAYSKAHGKTFRIDAAPGTFADWLRPPAGPVSGGWVTAPGLFSADGPDEGSIALGKVLPADMKGRVADLGAGWGYLAFQVLEREKVASCTLIEAEHAAIEAARRNVRDDRAEFVWGDARSYTPERRFDAVVSNPPFHTTRAADPALGAAFIDSAARILAPHGTFWMVANRHLPYEAPLRAAFHDVTELSAPEGSGPFKLFAAKRPSRAQGRDKLS